MASLNKVLIMGNLGRDPETRLAGQSKVCSFTVAITEKWKDKATGEQKTATEWVPVTIWGKLAEIAEQYLRKGASVYIEGKWKTRSWEDQEGKKQYKTELVAESMQMLGGKSDGGQSHQSPEPSQPANPNFSSSAAGDNDELPF